VAINLSLFIFHVFFLNTPPQGFLITAGSMLIALSFAVSGLMSSRLVRMGLSITSILAVIAGSWMIHSNFSTSPVDLTPMFRYDYAWPPTQILFTAFSAAFFIGTLGQLVNLSIPAD
jgi:hypothetical protein